MAAEEEEEELLVEEREEEMLPSLHSQKPIKRKAWFLKSISRTSINPFAPSHYKPISISPSEAPRILFKGWLCPQKQWKRWVDKLQPIYKELWEKVGIFDAIMASTFIITRAPSSFLGAVGFWCEETNTFIFPWGEATITLEDVMVLGGFSVLGEPVRVAKPLEDELGELEWRMDRERKDFCRKKCKKPADSEWISHYIEGEGDELEHIAFLSLWLTRFVFPSHPYKTVGKHVIPIAIRLARGARIALAPAVLASLYCDLGAMKDHLTRRRNSELTVWAPLQIMQLWVWERFLALRPKSQNFVDSDQPRAARWHDVGKIHKTLDFSFVMSVLESPDEFQWQPYVTCLDNWRKPSFYKDRGEWVYGNVIRNEELGLFAYCLRDSELVGIDCIEQYLPHRVALQFGLDQDVPNYVSRVNLSWQVAWETYDIGTKDVLFYVPPRLSESDVSLQYSIWWKEVAESFKEKIRGKKRKKTQYLPYRKKKLQDIYDTCCKSMSKKSREKHNGARKSVKVKRSSKHSETMNQNADALKETKLGEVVATEAMDIDKVTTGDLTNNFVKSAYDLMIDLEVVEAPEEKSEIEEVEHSKMMDNELERELKIKKLKEEIELLDERIMVIESRAKMHT